MMKIAAYRLFYENIHEFKTTAVCVEAEIRRHGIRSDGEDEVPGMEGRTHHDIWVSMKTVSHFNLGISIESMLKLLLFLNRRPIPQHHRFAELYDAIPLDVQTKLETIYVDSRAALPQGYKLRASINTTPSASPTLPPDWDISSLRGFLEYLDDDVMLWQKRYSWELVNEGRWRHYLSDISVFAELIDRVMLEIPRP